jgi:PAS domain S-box-containing protein
MAGSALDETGDGQSIVRRFYYYLLISVGVFLFLMSLMLFPQIRSTLNNLQTQSDEASARTYASILDRYIQDREYALSDIAQSPYVLNAALLAKGERADFRDFINSSNLLQEDPVLTVLDINADVLYSELEDAENYAWALKIIEGEAERILSLKSDIQEPQFELAIPIIYGRGREGVLVSRFSANPDRIFSFYEGLNETSGVSYEKDTHIIQSDLSQIDLPHIESQFVEKYGVNISHITSRRSVVDQRQSFIFKALIAGLAAAALAFTFFMIYGRRIIVKPYLELAVTQEAISKAVEGISRIDTNGVYVHLNNAYANTAGYEPHELVGKDWIVTVYPDDVDKLNQAYEDMLKDGSVQAEARGIRKDGTIFYKQVTMITQFDASGEFIGHHCFMKDISERKKAEQQREKLVEELSESNEELERFAFVCSHDLQEPLRTVTSFSGRLETHLKDQLKDDEKGQKYLRFMTDAAQRSQDLIHDILAYSRVNSDIEKLENVDLNELVDVIQKNSNVGKVVSAKQISSDKLPEVRGNKTQLYQLFQNLINNGLKYQKSDEPPHVHVGVEDLGSQWQFSLKDNGIGIAEEYHSKIFEVFQRLHRRSEFSGTGVGLSICKKVVKKHGGNIWVESSVGEGSTFYFTLPKHNV